MTSALRLSDLSKTWFVDIDGVIFGHNRYANIHSGVETPLPGAREFFSKLPKGDFVVLVTARSKRYEKLTTSSLKAAGIRFDLLIMNLPPGERILINDIKPSGLKTAYAVNLERDKGLKGVSFVRI